MPAWWISYPILSWLTVFPFVIIITNKTRRTCCNLFVLIITFDWEKYCLVLITLFAFLALKACRTWKDCKTYKCREDWLFWTYYNENPQGTQFYLQLITILTSGLLIRINHDFFLRKQYLDFLWSQDTGAIGKQIEDGVRLMARGSEDIKWPIHLEVGYLINCLHSKKTIILNMQWFSTWFAGSYWDHSVSLIDHQWFISGIIISPFQIWIMILILWFCVCSCPNL